MLVNRISGLNNIGNYCSDRVNFKGADKAEDKSAENKNKKLAFALAGLAAAGLSAVIIAKMLKSGKQIKLSDISFKPVLNGKIQEGAKPDGIARLKSTGEKFTGMIEHTNSKGDKFNITYVDGLLMKSTKNIDAAKGTANLMNGNFEKIYNRNILGKLLNINVSEYVCDGKITKNVVIPN